MIAEMKLPKRIADLLQRKQEFIDFQRTKLENSVVRMQSQLFADIIAELIPELDVVDGVIQETAKNYRLLSVLDRTYRDFQSGANQKVLEQMFTGTTKIGSLNNAYYASILTDLPKRFDKVLASTEKLMNLRLGLDGGKLVRGGYLESFFNSNTIGTDLKQMTSKAITSGTGLKEFTKMLKNKITGSAEYTGGLERQYARYAFDIYQQYDRSYNSELANEFGLKYFVYKGTLINDSRDFCVAHLNKVYTTEEAQEWTTWTPSKGEYPDGYTVKAKDIYSVPSYLGYPGYDPLIDCGGYNCRHYLGFIPDDVAFGMRPDLKEEEIK